MAAFKIDGIMLQIYANLSKSHRNRHLRPGNRCSVENRAQSKTVEATTVPRRSKLKKPQPFLGWRIGESRGSVAPSSIGCLYLEIECPCAPSPSLRFTACLFGWKPVRSNGVHTRQA